MRRLLAFCCLLFLLLTLGGRALFYELRLAELRADMRAAIAEGRHPDQVQRFSFSEADCLAVRWLDGGKEFEWKGVRFDVLSRRQEGGRLLLLALPDNKETALVAGFRQQQQKEGGLPASVLILKLASLSYLPPQDVACPVIDHTVPSVFNGRCRQLLPQTYRTRPGRPPRDLVFCS